MTKEEIRPTKIPAIEIATCEPMAGRLPAQAKARASAQGDARQQCLPETISIVEFHPSWRAVTPMSNSFVIFSRASLAMNDLPTQLLR